MGRLACHVTVADRAGRQVELSWASPAPPRSTSHQRTIPSLPPVSTSSPLEAQVSAETTPGCPAKALLPAPQAGWRSPLWASHTTSSPPSLLPPPEASREPSGLQATLVTAP